MNTYKISDDGFIRRTSFAQMTERRNSPKFTTISDVPLRGAVTTLHLVQNDTTKESYIVGGSDDGCLAFWSQEYLPLLLG